MLTCNIILPLTQKILTDYNCYTPYARSNRAKSFDTQTTELFVIVPNKCALGDARIIATIVSFRCWNSDMAPKEYSSKYSLVSEGFLYLGILLIIFIVPTIDYASKSRITCFNSDMPSRQDLMCSIDSLCCLVLRTKY